MQPAVRSQRSSVQVSPSAQRVSSGVATQPTPGLQVSIVQATPSLHTRGGCWQCAPALHRSPGQLPPLSPPPLALVSIVPPIDARQLASVMKPPGPPDDPFASSVAVPERTMLLASLSVTVPAPK